MRWVVVTFAALTFLMLACGDGGSGATSASCTNDATAEAVISGSGEFLTPGAYRPVDDETHCRLRRALLTLDDMPAGWRNSRFTFTGAHTDHIEHLVSSPVCGGVPAYRFTAGLEGSYEADAESMGGPEWKSVSQLLLAFQEGAAQRFVDAVRHSCLLMEGTRGDVYGLIGEVAEGSFGGDSLLARGEIEPVDDESSELPWTMSVLHRDDVVSLVTTIGPALEAEQFNTFVQGRIDNIGALPEATPVPNEGCPPSPEPTPGPGSDILRGALLALGDMDAGWVEAPPEPCGLLGIENSCAAEQTDFVSVQPRAEASAGFARGENRYVRQNVAVFEPDDVEQVFRSMGEWIGNARTCVLTFKNETLTVRYGPAPLPEGIADGYAWYVVAGGLSQFDELLAYAVQFRRGNLIVRVQHAAPSFGRLPADATPVLAKYLEWRLEQVAPYVEKADKKLTDIEDEIANLE